VPYQLILVNYRLAWMICSCGCHFDYENAGVTESNTILLWNDQTTSQTLHATHQDLGESHAKPAISNAGIRYSK